MCPQLDGKRRRIVLLVISLVILGGGLAALLWYALGSREPVRPSPELAAAEQRVAAAGKQVAATEEKFNDAEDCFAVLQKLSRCQLTPEAELYPYAQEQIARLNELIGPQQISIKDGCLTGVEDCYRPFLTQKKAASIAALEVEVKALEELTALYQKRREGIR